MSRNENFWVGQVTVPHPPLGNDKGWGTTKGGGVPRVDGFWGGRLSPTPSQNALSSRQDAKNGAVFVQCNLPEFAFTVFLAQTVKLRVSWKYRLALIQP